MEKMWEIFVDGASRGNPGFSGAGIYIKYENESILKKGIFLGKKTNNQAEYLALALALFYLKKELSKSESQNHNIKVTSDSELLIKQMKGEYKVKNPILKQIKNLIDLFLQDTNCKFKHVLRENNKIADKLANVGIDEKNEIPISFANLLSKHVTQI